MDFTYSRVAQQPGLLADFSARGPNVESGIKPDLTATGTDLWIATQTLDWNGQMYDPSGYTLADGTSFAAPLVAGAAAVVKAARPSLDARAIRSALINSTAPAADETAAWIQRGGAGLLDLEAAVRAAMVSSEVSLSFGAMAPGSRPQPRAFTVKHLGEEPETYFVRVEPRHRTVAPAVSAARTELAAGGETELQVEWPEAATEPGTYDGFILLEAASSGAVLRIPYWMAVTDRVPASITLLDQTTQARRFTTVRDAILFRVVDASGVPVSDADVLVESLDAGTVVRVDNYDADSPGVYGVTVRLGVLAGPNRFRVRAGSVELVFTVTGY